MARATIHVVQLGSEDWVVGQDGGRELGHYPSRDVAAGVGRILARKHRAELIIQGQSGKAQTERPAKSWLGRLFGR
jgi:hypothetical protein